MRPRPLKQYLQKDFNFLKLTVFVCLAAFGPFGPYAYGQEAGKAKVKDCGECHQQEKDSFTLTKHGMDHRCSTCHSGADDHAADPQAKDLVANPRRLSRVKGNGICLQCHADKREGAGESLRGQGIEGHEQLRCYDCHIMHLKTHEDREGLDAWEGESSVDCGHCHKQKVKDLADSSHASSRVSCVDCHQVHEKLGPGISPVNAKIEKCLSCHPKQELEFRSFYRHPLNEQGIQCASCHDPHSDRYDHMLIERDDKACADCHRDIYIENGKHPTSKGTDHPFQSVKCMDCHEPHGSNYNRVLKYDSSRICTTCHK